jgi:hypothetical protein
MNKISFFPGNYGILMQNGNIIAIISPSSEENKIRLAIIEEWVLDEDDVVHISGITHQHDNTLEIEVSINQNGDTYTHTYTLEQASIY